jgi:hypothetical protein
MSEKDRRSFFSCSVFNHLVIKLCRKRVKVFEIVKISLILTPAKISCKRVALW